jgi:dTDP-4-dehydrorhamnose reductase
MKVAVIGKNGQLAWELARSLPTDWQMAIWGSSELNIVDRGALATRLTDFKPQVVINCAAYTAVDKAESDAINAYAVNESGAGNLAAVCSQIGARLLHISTDFVFDGSKSSPYSVGDQTNPLGVYGASKLAGEQQVLRLLPESSVVVRTSWVYSAHGNNFVKTILRLLKEKPQLNVVADQIGSPTWAKNLASWLWAVASKPEAKGLYHWSDAGAASWYDFAVAIQELALEKGLLRTAVPIYPIPSAAYPTPAKRPHYSVMDKREAEAVSDIRAGHWRQSLSQMLNELK